MTNLETTLHTKLDELITAVKTSAIPLRDRWIDAETAGAMLSVSAYTFRQAYACRPDFPKPLREIGASSRRSAPATNFNFLKSPQRDHKGQPMANHCKGCSHPTICKTHGCAAVEYRRNENQMKDAEYFELQSAIVDAPRSVRDEIMRLRGEVARLSAHIAEIE